MCNQSFCVSPKGLAHANSGFTQVLISIYCLIYWKEKAQPHKSSQNYCAMPHACIYNVTHEREMRASPYFHWAPEKNKGQSEQLANLYWVWGIITRLHPNELFSWNLLLCLLQKVQRKVYLQIGADTWNLCLLHIRQPNAQPPHAQTNGLMGLLLKQIINS